MAGKKGNHKLQVPQVAVQQQLVICNAYASPKALEIVHVRARQTLTQGKPLAYKQCKDFTVPLEEGDQIDFKAGALDVGTFYATGLPKSSGSLLLIPNRRSPQAVGVSFQSHAFVEMHSPQIAVIDAYHGNIKNQAEVKIIQNAAPTSGDKAEQARVEEELNFNSVVAVNPGKYEISLTGTGGDQATTVPLNAADSAKYVVMRLGNDDAKSGSYPEELIVFPNSAARSSIRFGVYLLTIVAALLGLRDVA